MQTTDILRAHGLKATPRRVAMLELIRARGPLSAEEVYQALSESGDAPSLSTVYRAVDALCEKGILVSVTLPGQTERRYNWAGTHYFLCTACHRCIAIDDSPMTAYARSLEKCMGLQVQQLQFTGLCGKCKGTNP